MIFTNNLLNRDVRTIFQQNRVACKFWQSSFVKLLHRFADLREEYVLKNEFIFSYSFVRYLIIISFRIKKRRLMGN